MIPELNKLNPAVVKTIRGKGLMNAIEINPTDGENVTFINVAKYNLGKVRLKLMQSVVLPCTVHDLHGGPLEICRAFVSCCLFSCSAVC